MALGVPPAQEQPGSRSEFILSGVEGLLLLAALRGNRCDRSRGNAAFMELPT